MSPETRIMRREIRKLTLSVRWVNFLARITPDGLIAWLSPDRNGSHRA